MRDLNRRDTLKGMAAAVAAPALARSSSAATAALPPLPTLPIGDALLLQPGQAGFDDYQKKVSNLRTMKRPKLRALCKTPNAVATMVDWSRGNNLPFALRSGGHSYEGFSQSLDVVIDTRLMNEIVVDTTNSTMTVGAGAALGDIYYRIRAGFAFPGGSCPTVGVTGHALGGGYGMIARQFGLACDSLQWVELVNAEGKIVEADAQQADLFWALRGGGGGSFGAVTRLRFKIYPIGNVVTLVAKWPPLSQARAAKLMQAWQAWAPKAPRGITTLMHVNHGGNGTIAMLCTGQSTGSMAELQSELRHLTSVAAPTQPLGIKGGSVWDAVQRFSGVPPFTGTWPYLPAFFKAKSDYVQTPLSAAGIATLMSQIAQRPGVGAICDCYGGAIADVAPEATAFVHRAGTLFGIQYYKYFAAAADGPAAIASLQSLYKAMRPFVSGAAYVNYPDLDLKDKFAQAYWGANLPRLKQIKATVDPHDVFHHDQSVPLI